MTQDRIPAGCADTRPSRRQLHEDADMRQLGERIDIPIGFWRRNRLSPVSVMHRSAPNDLRLLHRGRKT